MSYIPCGHVLLGLLEALAQLPQLWLIHQLPAHMEWMDGAGYIAGEQLC